MNSLRPTPRCGVSLPLVLTGALCFAALASCSSDGDETEPVAVSCTAYLDELTELTRSNDATDGCDWLVTPGADDHATLQTALVEAGPSEVICLAAGTFKVTRELNLGTPFITLRGAGREATTIDFEGQNVGANGIHITSDNVTIEALTVKDTAGDGIRATGTRNLIIRNTAVIWSKAESEENGAYGLYPVQCDGVLIEGSLVRGSRDAGIYVGQSKNIVVQNNEATGNVAGIEIENSFDAVVRDNYAHNNTGGILVFNLPNLPQKNGRRCLVENNRIENNNLKNFGLKGTVVGKVPPGTGMILLAVDETEVTGNTITGNKSFGLAMLYYEPDLFGSHDDAEFDPYTESTWIHDNTWSNNGQEPDGITLLIQEDTIGDVAFGGCLDPDKDHTDGALRNCVNEPEGTTWLNFDLCGGFQNKSRDIADAGCTRPSLGEVTHCADGNDCGTAPEPVEPVAGDGECGFPYPTLSDYEFFDGPLADQQPAAGVHPYEVASPLWSDGAGKDRFIVLPEGQTIGFSADGALNFPVGTTLIKTFSFGGGSSVRHIETRLLVLEAHGWTPHTYIWNAEQTDALRAVAGREIPAEESSGGAPYIVPSVAQCASCHVENGQVVPLGPVARQLHRSVMRDGAAVDQLSWLAARGVFGETPDTTAVTANVDPFGDASLDARARAYLDANCGHCHRRGGVAGSTGLRLDSGETNPTNLGLCKTPVAAGSGAGNLTYDIVPGAPDQSILIFRMESQKAGIQMPELPLMTLDTAGIALIREWISEMPADDCNP